MTASVSISIPGALPKELGKGASHSWQKTRKAWAAAVDYGIALWREANTHDHASAECTPWESVEIEVQQFYCGVPLDGWNLATKVAAYVDAAQELIPVKGKPRTEWAAGAGIIKDDSWKTVREYRILRPERVAKRAEARTQITIREVDPCD